MKFSLKVFIGIFAVASSVLGMLSFFVLRLTERQAEAGYIERYQQFSNQLGDTLVELDKGTDAIMLNALRVLREKEKQRGLLSNAELSALKDELGVGSLYIADASGKFIRSDWFYTVANDSDLQTHYRDSKPLNRGLFSYCSDYRRLITGQSSIEKTPLIPSGHSRWPFKFAMIPNHDRSRILEADMALESIGNILRKLLKSDPNAISIGLFSPTGVPIGEVQANESNAPQNRATLYASNVSTIRKTAAGFTFFTNVPAATPQCCECRAKGLTKADSDYYYVLRTEISRKALDAQLASLRRRMLAALLAALALSAIIAHLLSRRLVKKLSWLGEKMGVISTADEANSELLLPGNDEVAALARKFHGMLERLRESQSQLASAAREKAFAEMAHQVAHDIRSPLAALDSSLKNVAILPEGPRSVVRDAVERIRDIANNLVGAYRDAKKGAESQSNPGTSAGRRACLLSSLIEPIVTEKRLEFRSSPGVEIIARLDAASYGLFADVDSVDFKRVLSNLISNGVEALPGKGTVNVSLIRSSELIELRVEDDGKGIPPEVLSKLGRRGETYGKPGGSGLGIYHANATAEVWGGSLKIDSEVGRGTVVTVSLPAAQPPAWFVSQLELAPNGPVVVLDDDPTIHQIWQGRFDAQPIREGGVDVVHCSRSGELRRWVMADPAKAATAVYLLDYELRGEEQTGLSLAKELNLGSRAILVTSRFEDKAILDECVRLGIRLIPKGMAGCVPICFDGAGERIDAVLIDDDKLTRRVWYGAAKSGGRTLRAFSTPNEFLAVAETLDKGTPIYVDSRLKDGVRGEEFAKELRGQGFTNLYLATGHPKESFPSMPWLTDIVGKDAPWR